MPKKYQAPPPSRLKGFPKLPRLPHTLAPPGDTQSDVDEMLFQEAKAKYPNLVRPEWLVLKWLTNHFGEGSQGVEWDFQVPLIGGRQIAGGAVADFIIYAGGLARGMVWRTSDEHFHFDTPAAAADYIIEKEWLEGEGWVVIDLLGAHLEQDVDRVCRAALAGHQLFTDPQSGGFLPPRTIEA